MSRTPTVAQVATESYLCGRGSRYSVARGVFQGEASALDSDFDGLLWCASFTEQAQAHEASDEEDRTASAVLASGKDVCATGGSPRRQRRDTGPDRASGHAQFLASLSCVVGRAPDQKGLSLRFGQSRNQRLPILSSARLCTMSEFAGGKAYVYTKLRERLFQTSAQRSSPPQWSIRFRF